MRGFKYSLRLLSTGLAASLAVAALTLPVMSVTPRKSHPRNGMDWSGAPTTRSSTISMSGRTWTFKAYKKVSLTR